VSPPATEPAAPVRSILVTVTGPDHPGVTHAIFGALAGPGVQVLDVEQAVVRGQLVLSVLVTAGSQDGAVMAAVHAAGAAQGMTVSCLAGLGDNPSRPAGRLHVTLLGDPLLPVAVASIAGRLAEHGANIDRIRRLSRWPVTTVEFDVSGDRGDQLRRELAAEAGRHGIDVAVSPAGLARRGRRLVVMDVDSTLIQDEVIELLAARAGRAAEVTAVTDRAMRGELDFAASLHQRVACLAGLPVEVFDQVRADVRLTPGARTLCRTLHRLGFTLALVSGGFAEVVQPLAADLGIRHVRANRLEVAGGVLTGRVSGEVVDRAGKAAALREFAAAERLPLSRTVAIGDGANDLDMLAEAGLGIAFNAKPVVRAQADTSVSVPYLDAVLYLLGIPRAEILDADAADPEPVGQSSR
jgi:phosphoserine phosphatase